MSSRVDFRTGLFYPTGLKYISVQHTYFRENGEKYGKKVRFGSRVSQFSRWECLPAYPSIISRNAFGESACTFEVSNPLGSLVMM